MPIACVAIDSGFQTQSVYNFCKPRSGRRLFAVKGMNTAGKPIAGRPVQTGKQRVPLVPVGTDSAKEVIFGWLQISEPSPGYIHFPSDVDNEYFKQLTAEKRVIKYYKGYKRLVFKPIRERNEALDCWVYCLAAFHILQPNLEKIAMIAHGESKRIPPKNTSVFKRSRPHKSFVNNWK